MTWLRLSMGAPALVLCLALGLVPGAGCGANVADDADRGPHLVSPSPGSSANGESVLLRWSTPTSAPVHLQLCADRACKEIITERDVAGGTTSVERSGRKGVVFWHVRADGVTSPTWTFAWGATGLGLARGTDVNGDGFPDVYVGTYFVGKVAKFSPGGPQGVSDPLPFCDLSTSSVSGGFIEAAGDVNGDGFADALVHLADTTMSTAVSLCFGAPSGVVGKARVLSEVQDAGRGPRAYVTAVGDVNGDGYADLANLTTILFGPDLVRTQPVTDADACDVRSIGDIDGDGFGDIAVTRCSDLRLTILRGTTEGPVVIGSVPQGTLAVGDLDGDGFSDLFYHCLLGAGIIGHACDAMPATATGFVVFFGSASGTLQPRDIDVPIPEDFRGHEKPIPADPVLWDGVVPTGDVDGDGRADLLAACVGTSGVHGFDVFMRGSRSGPQYAPELGFAATSSQYAPTNAYSDLDLDGFPDLITLRLGPSTSGSPLSGSSLLVEFGPRGSGRTQTLPFDRE